MLQVTDPRGKPLPSSGFNSVYVMAHEIGHNLGMFHDSDGNSCPKDGYLMSPSRGTKVSRLFSCEEAALEGQMLSVSVCLSVPKTEFHHSSFNCQPLSY